MRTPNKRAAIALLFAAWTAMGPANGDQFTTDTKAVVELFTSQGCAQCPPAEALLAELGQHSNIVTLAYHVDYWDFMGWTDDFGSRENSDRQRAYNKRWGASRIFTPQMVINGHQGLVGSREDEVRRAIASAQLSVPITLDKTGDTLKVAIPPEPSVDNASVWAVTYIPSIVTPIGGGENEGQSLPFHYVVTDREHLGNWTSTEGAEFEISLSSLSADGLGVAILLQDDRNDLPGTILAAASYNP
ncbi:DUF1223 domain-containing protein [Devosia sp. WQ 349]|uniref:DUF1223 domain-containing protein n=1 Tax=Devosia sp. WQ 349K1 TaxID=2800329 RepID=UPI001903196A|nr:DUF1223 domain-containing protein [Devosia sp. WQ 349K1]MBK1795596.1 DUF1223 domain-containing protein [Devosia sp. WQ 349K1]